VPQASELVDSLKRCEVFSKTGDKFLCSTFAIIKLCHMVFHNATTQKSFVLLCPSTHIHLEIRLIGLSIHLSICPSVKSVIGLTDF